jgi:uncharacterized protein (DUF2147 family)
MERKIGSEDFEVDDEDDNRRKSKGKNKGSGKKRRDGDDQVDEDGGWESVIDPETGKTYYINTITQKTQWEKPY